MKKVDVESFSGFSESGPRRNKSMKEIIDERD
jgi:hypothetical protein